MAAALETDGLDPTAKLLLIVIADHINDETGWAWPSISRLAKRCGIHRTNVVRWIDRLEQAGLIQVRRGEGRSNHYRLTSSAGAPTSSAGATSPFGHHPVDNPQPTVDNNSRSVDNPVDNPVDNRTPTSSAGAHQLVAPAHQTSSAGATRTIRNQKKNQQPTPLPPPIGEVLADLDTYR